MLLWAKGQGICEVFATPHSSAFDGDPENTRERYRLLCARFAQILPEVKLHLGCEVSCDAMRMPEVLSRLKTGQYPTMNGTQFVLIEFSHRVMPESATPCAERGLQWLYENVSPEYANAISWGNARRLLVQ